MALRRVRSKDEADQRETEVVPISCALRPSFDLFVSLQIMPRLSACFVQEPPSLDVSRLLGTGRGCRRAAKAFSGIIGVAV